MTRLIIAAGLALGTTTAADETVTFDGDNVGGWSYFGDPVNTPEVIAPEGGNPGAYLLAPCDGGLDCLDTFAPSLRTYIEGGDNPFVGNYRDMGVTSLGTDLIQLNNATTGDRPLTVILRGDTMNTPEDPFDDTLVYLVGPNIPGLGEGWVSYDYDVPAASESLPAGWKVTLDSPLQGDEAWNAVIEQVDQVTFYYGDPDFFYIFQQWSVGADNIRVTTADACDADCNGDGVLNVLDFVCFQNEWNAQSDAGDCDGNGAFDVLDFVCFQNLFSAGCN